MSEHAFAYRPVTFAELPGWDADDHGAALRAFLDSCVHWAAAAGTAPRTAGDPPPPDRHAICDIARRLAAEPADGRARAFFEQSFVPHAVMHAAGGGLLTGYYEPELEASRRPEGAFRFPILRRPADLVNLVDEAERATVVNGLTHARQTAAGIVPFPTREAIETGALAGQGLELAYLADPVDLFFLHVQGSGRLRFRDGTTARISYAGKNGHPYSSIGRHLIEQGIIGADKMSLAALAGWLKADPERGRRIMWRNASYVFFRELTGAEAASALGVRDIPLTAGRSLAVDASLHALGTPIYVSAPGLLHATASGPFQRLMIAQDVGSAIRGPERGDIYFGTGQAAGELAGITKHAGRFYVLLPRDTGPPAPGATPGRSRYGAAR